MWRSRVQDAALDPVELVPSGGDRRLRLLSHADSFAGSLALLGEDLVKEVCLGAAAPLEGKPMKLACRGNDHHSLVLSWIETLLYMMEERQVALAEIQVQVGRGFTLEAQCRTRSIRGDGLAMPKALDPQSARATESEEGLWQAECTLLMGEKR